LHSDHRLANRMKQGDRRAFEEFVDLYGARVHRLVGRYVDNAEDAADVTQEVFIDLYRGIRSFRGESSVMTWVYRIAVNHCLRHCERASRATSNTTYMSNGSYGAESTDSDWRSNPEQSAAKSELGEQVYAELGRLQPMHRDVVILHELHGLTYIECATALDVPVGTVKSRLSNAFKKMRSGLQSYVMGDCPSVTQPAGEAAK
jgi:RNA polymerase sigma-70 factor (ECF subfamily)